MTRIQDFLQSKNFQNKTPSISSKISGIGVNIVNDAGKIRIISVIEETPHNSQI